MFDFSIDEWFFGQDRCRKGHGRRGGRRDDDRHEGRRTKRDHRRD